MAHIGALRAWEGRPPVGIKVVIEGQEEVGSALNDYPATDPALFRADAMVIADMGSVRPGVPTLTIGLRGMAQTTMEVETLAGPKHSGQYGGAAPDALGVLLQALATLHDENGDVAVEGLRREPWTGAGYTEDEFRTLAEVKDDLPLVGSGDLGSRVWSGPAITVTGIDITSVDDALNAVNARARAKINTRVHPAQDADEAQEAVVSHLEATRPFGIGLTVQPGATGNGFLAETTGPAYAAAREAMQAAWGIEASYAASGGSIPLVSALQLAVPDAEILLLGTTDGYANIHAPNERVLLEEFEKAVLVETEFLGRFAASSPRDRARSEHERTGGTVSSDSGRDAADPRSDRARRQQDAEPRDPVRLVVRDRDHRLRPAGLGGHQGHVPGRPGATGPGRGGRPGRLHPALRRPPYASVQEGDTRSPRRRRRSRASCPPTGSGSSSPPSSPTSGTSRRSRSSSS